MKIKKSLILFCIVAEAVLLSACGGQKERNKDIPTEEEALAYAKDELGIKGADVLSSKDVRNEGKEYYEIDAVYEVTSDRGLDFTLLRSFDYDTLFGAGYYYGWVTDYSDRAIRDYLKDHPLPSGISYSDSDNARSNYGADRYFGDSERQLIFEFSSDEEFEGHLNDLEKWLDDWLSYERQYLAEGKDPKIMVAAYRLKDDTMDYPILMYRKFGYEKDSFHKIGEDGETYTWASFRKAMETGYEAKKELTKK